MSIWWRPNGGWGEFGLVVIGAFGWFIVSSLYYALHPATYPGHSTGTFWYLTVYEIAILILLGTLLRYRGWSARSLGLSFLWSDIPAGLAIAATAWLSYAGAFWLLRLAAPQLAAAATGIHVIQNGVSAASALSVVVVNPIYEEIFVAGYIIAALKDGRHTALAINVSVAVRLLYHLYQGVAAVVGVLPLGLIFATWFAYQRRLWPLIIAHALFDAVGILAFVQWL